MKDILNSIIYTPITTCSHLQKVALSSHQSCYTSNEFCNDILLNENNLNYLATEVFNSSGIWNEETTKQVWNQ